MTFEEKVALAMRVKRIALQNQISEAEAFEIAQDERLSWSEINAARFAIAVIEPRVRKDERERVVKWLHKQDAEETTWIARAIQACKHSTSANSGPKPDA